MFAVGVSVLAAWSLVPVIALALQSPEIFLWLPAGFIGVPLLEADPSSNLITILSIPTFWALTIALWAAVFLSFRDHSALTACGTFPNAAGVALGAVAGVLMVAAISFGSEVSGLWEVLSRPYRQPVPGGWVRATTGTPTWVLFFLSALGAGVCLRYVGTRVELWLRLRWVFRSLFVGGVAVAVVSAIGLFRYLSTSNFGYPSLVPAIEAAAVGHYSGLALSLWVLVWTGGCYLRFSPFLNRMCMARHETCPSCGYDLRASLDRCPECGRAIG